MSFFCIDMEYANQGKADLEAKVAFLEEENRKAITECAKFKKGFENANKAVHDFVCKTKENANDAFADGFCLAQKQILDRNPEADLSGLNGLVHPAWLAEWFSPDILRLAPSDVAPSPKTLHSSLVLNFLL